MARWINKNLYKIPIVGIGAFASRYSNTFSIYSSREDKLLYSTHKRTPGFFLNIGSGGFHHINWTNYDYPGLSNYYRGVQGIPNKDYVPIDLCDKDNILEFDRLSLDLIYISHTLEHIEYSSTERLFSNLSPALKENGIIRIVLPDIDFDFERARIAHKSPLLPLSIKNKLITNSAIHMYSCCRSIRDQEIIEMVKSSNFNPEIFSELICKNYSYFNIFNHQTPGNHITYWNSKKLLELSHKFDLHCFRRTCLADSSAKPFSNRYVFDTTEPHLSCYYEISKSL